MNIFQILGLKSLLQFETIGNSPLLSLTLPQVPFEDPTIITPQNEKKKKLSHLCS